MRVVSNQQRQNIARFFGQVQETARRVFTRDGVCVPVAIFLLEDRETVLPLGKFGANKDVAAMLLKRLIEEIKPLAFVMVTEAWMATAPHGAKNLIGAEEDVTKKYNGTLVERTCDGQEKPKDGVKEVVMLQCCSATGENFMLSADIVRNADCRPALEEWQRMENRESTGRFIFDAVPVTERQ